MFHKNCIVYFGALLTLCVAVASTPSMASAQQVGELGDNNVAIIPLCNCVESEEKAKSSQCQKLFAQQNPQQRPTARAGGAMHGMGAIQPPIQQ
jgi:hypothetical protein